MNESSSLRADAASDMWLCLLMSDRGILRATRAGRDRVSGDASQIRRPRKGTQVNLAFDGESLPKADLVDAITTNMDEYGLFGERSVPPHCIWDALSATSYLRRPIWDVVSATPYLRLDQTPAAERGASRQPR